MLRHNAYSEEYYETDLSSLRILWDTTRNVHTAKDLRECIASLPQRYADVRYLIERALDFFAEPKVFPNGKRDGKKIWKHIQMGYGRRLTDRAPVSPNLLIGLTSWIYADSPVPLSEELHRKLPLRIVRNKRYPHGYALDLLRMVDMHKRGMQFTL